MKRRLPTILGVFLTLSFTLLAANRLDWTTESFLTSLDMQWLDTKFRMRGERAPGNDLVLVALDDRSLEALGSARLFERHHAARLVDQLSQAGARVIGFDITYSEVDPTNPENDRLFAEAIENAGNVVMGTYFELQATTGQSGERGELSPEFQEIVIEKQVYPSLRTSGTEGGETLIQGNTLVMNLPLLTRAAASFGSVNVHTDSNGSPRYQPQFIEWGGRLYPSLDLQLLKRFLNAPSVGVTMQDGRMEQVQVGDYIIPTDRYGRYMVNFNGPANTYPTVSWIDVEEGRVDPAALRDKIVIVGPTAIGLGDVLPTPFDPVLPGVEVHANIIDNILQQSYLVRGTIASMIDLLIILVGGVLVSLYLPRMGASRSIVYTVVGLLGFTGLNVWVFLQFTWVLSYVYPGLALVFTSGSLISYKYLTEEREKKRTKQVFSHYLDQAVIDQVIDQPDKLKLGGEKHSLTVLFSDIKGFSTFSEQMSPQELVGFLNTYFDEMTEIIFKYQGTLDKLIGDAVMCFWGHPVETEEHPLRATIAALEMMQVVRQIQESVNLPGGHRFDIRIGVNTGDMVVGNMGSQHRFSYTVMGDDVNLGARLEPLNKYYGTNILISGSTYEKVKDRIFCRELDRVTVKGKEHAVTIYEPLGLRRPEKEQRVSERRSDPTLWKRFKGAYVAGRHGERRRSDRRQGSAELLVDPKWDEIRTIFEHALELYRSADFDGAEQAFDHVMKLAPGDGPSLMMKARIEKCRLELVDAKSEFDPVHKFDEK